MFRLNVSLLFLFFVVHLFSLEQSQHTHHIKHVTKIEVDQAITPSTFEYIKESLKKDPQDMLLIKLNTPGGLVTTTHDILKMIGEAKVPVVIWITPAGASATSAGAIISSGAHFVFMTKGTRIGAATPINMSGDIEQKDIKAKAINDLTAQVRSLSKLHGRNDKAYSLMIKEAKSFDAEEALKEKIINRLISTEDEIFHYLQNKVTTLSGITHTLDIAKDKDLKIETFEMDAGLTLLSFFANPSLTYIFFLLGAALLYFELQSPGGIIAGALGVLFLILAGIGFQVLPLNLGALGLIALSLILFILESFVTSYGILSIAGLASLVFGSLFIYRTENSLIDLELSLIIGSTLSVGGYMAFIAFYMFKTRRSQMLKKESALHEPHESREAIVAKIDPSKTSILVKFDGTLWSASIKNDILVDNLKEGSKVLVRPKEPGSINYETLKILSE